MPLSNVYFITFIKQPIRRVKLRVLRLVTYILTSSTASEVTVIFVQDQGL